MAKYEYICTYPIDTHYIWTYDIIYLISSCIAIKINTPSIHCWIDHASIIRNCFDLFYVYVVDGVWRVCSSTFCPEIWSSQICSPDLLCQETQTLFRLLSCLHNTNFLQTTNQFVLQHNWSHLNLINSCIINY